MRNKKNDYWQNHIELQKRSGQTIQAYCDNHNIATHKFYYWKAKLAKEKNLALFLPVSIQEDDDKNEIPSCDLCSSGVLLNIQGRYQIHLETTFNSDTLLKLIDTLEQR